MLAKTMFCSLLNTEKRFYFCNHRFCLLLVIIFSSQSLHVCIVAILPFPGAYMLLKLFDVHAKECKGSPPPLFKQNPGGWSRGRSPRKVISLNVLCRQKSTLCLCALSTITCFVSVTRCMDSISGLVEWLIFSCLIFLK